jgi:hypothetical protein
MSIDNSLGSLRHASSDFDTNVPRLGTSFYVLESFILFVRYILLKYKTTCLGPRIDSIFKNDALPENMIYIIIPIVIHQ